MEQGHLASVRTASPWYLHKWDWCCEVFWQARPREWNRLRPLSSSAPFVPCSPSEPLTRWSPRSLCLTVRPEETKTSISRWRKSKSEWTETKAALPSTGLEGGSERPPRLHSAPCCVRRCRPEKYLLCLPVDMEADSSKCKLTSYKS